MEPRKTIPGRWAFDTGLSRPLLAYLVIVALGVWVVQLVQEATQGRDPVGAFVAATTALRNSLVALPFFSLLLLPAMILTLLALATAAVVVLGSMWMAGRWGGTAGARQS